MYIATVIRAIFLASLLVFWGCSDDPQPDRCETVNCEAGVCDPGTGECVNPAMCEASEECLTGFICDDGVCLEPAANDCRVDGCTRGECDTSTGQCVNAGSCTSGSEDVRCLEDYRCVSATCVDESTFCSNLTCARGECSFEALACVDSPQCDEDSDCLVGRFCDAGTCQENVCDADMIMCPRGVCDASSGECTNPEICSESNNCLDAFYCVEGACLSPEAACECAGNQVCEYNASDLTVSCVANPAGCTQAVDCPGGDICVEGTCAAPTACVPDRLEPNNNKSEASIYFDVEDGGNVRDLTICEGDVDAFIFDSRLDGDDLGTLRAEVSIPSTAVGQGVLTMRLIAPNGSQVGTATTLVSGVQTASARIDHVITNLNRGEYEIIVEGQDINIAGVPYALYVDVIGNEILNACNNAPVLLEAQAVTSISTSGASVAATTACGASSETVAEDIYQIHMDRPGFVTIIAAPQPLVDITVGLRRECARNESEFTCANAQVAGGIETLGAYLEPGNYYVVVQGASAGAGGGYGLTYTVEDVVCIPDTSACVDAQTAEVCNANGTGQVQILCEEGCDGQTGKCTPKLGDTCERPFVVSNFPFNTDIVWGDYQNSYDPGVAGCVPNNTTSVTTGADAVFQITLPPGEAVVANLVRNASFVSLYVSTDCADMVGSCAAAANSGRLNNEELIYLNETTQDQTIFLVADRGADSTTSNSASLTLDTRQIICVPGSRRCVLNRESQLCNSEGTSYDDSTFCEFGCDPQTSFCAAPPNNTCGGALTLVPNTTITGDLSLYTNNYATGTCPATGTTSTGLGRDAVFKMTLNEADIVTVQVEANFNVMLWYTNSCVADSLNTCLRRVNQTSSTVQDSETLQFVAPSAGDYFIVVDTVSSTIASGQFSISATVSSASCVPGEVFGCNAGGTALEYCTDLGITGEYACNGGCLNGACVVPQGDICADAIVLSGTSGQESHTFSGAFKVHDIPTTGQYGECTLSSALGFDRMFRVDLQAGEIFRMNYPAPGTTSTTLARIYAVKECGDIDTCFGVPYNGTDTFAHFASQAETFYLVFQYSSSASSTLAYTFNWEIDQTGFLCLPGASSCIDATTVEVCGADGTSSEMVSCSGACIDGACEIEPTADTCAGALDVGAGYGFTFDPTGFTDTNNFSALYCGGGTTPGRDAFFKVNMLPDEVLTVSASHQTTTHYPVISLFTGCDDPAGTCLAFDRGLSTNRQPSVTYQAKTSETVLISIDSTSSVATSRVSGMIEVRPPDCVAGTFSCNQDVQVACHQGQFFETTCTGGCQNGECVNPDGDSCYDAIPLSRAGGSTVAKAFQGTSFATNPTIGYWNQCVVGYIYNGIDLFYSVDLLAGERLQAELNGLTTAYLFLLEGCDLSTCLDHEPNDRRSVDYVSPVNQTVYLMVDRTVTGTSTSTVSIDYSITPGSGVCTPGKFQCIDADTAQRCDETGQISGPLYECPWGCDADVGRCRLDTAQNIDSCISAPVITQNFAGFGFHSSATNEVNLTTMSCVGTTTPGSDFFHAIDLQADQFVRITMDRANPNTSIFYIFKDCSDAEASCLDGRVTSTTATTVSLTYQAPADERIYLGIDTSTTVSDRPVIFDIEFLTPTCSPGVDPNVCNADSSALVYCDSSGFPREFACDGGCDPLTNRCVLPSGDSCVDPTVVASSGVLTASFASFTNVYSLPVTNMCTSSRTPGKDAVYEVSLSAGQSLTASVVSLESSPEDVAIYITDNCALLPDSCLDGSDSSLAGAETASFTAATDITVFVIVDSYFQGLTGEFELTLTIQ